MHSFLVVVVYDNHNSIIDGGDIETGFVVHLGVCTKWNGAMRKRSTVIISVK